MSLSAKRAESLGLRLGLSEIEACTYVGCGPTKFRELVLAGRMPRPRLIGVRRLFDIDELQIFFRELPRESEGEPKVNTWADFKNARDKA